MTDAIRVSSNPAMTGIGPLLSLRQSAARANLNLWRAGYPQKIQRKRDGVNKYFFAFRQRHFCRTASAVNALGSTPSSVTSVVGAAWLPSLAETAEWIPFARKFYDKAGCTLLSAQKSQRTI